jgi:hypothetical protein
MRKWAVNMAIAAAALLAALALAEAAVRWLMADTTVMFPRYHTRYQYGPYELRGTRPNETYHHTSVDGRWRFDTNARGFRDTRQFAYAKPAGTVRVLVLGDSHTQGFEVRQEATYAAVLERALGAARAPVEVMNAGVAGHGTSEQLAFLENEGARYRPDAVVVGFFANDYEDNVKAGLFALDAQERLVARAYSHLPGVTIQDFIYALPGVKWMSENSYFYSQLFNSAWIFFKIRLGMQATGKKAGELAGFAVPTQLAHSDEEVALAARLLERMKQFCDRNGMRLVVVDIPTYLERYRFATSIAPALRERLRAAGIEWIDSEPLLRDYAGSVDLHVPNGYHHVSEFTHGLIGVELGRRLRRP